MITTPVRSLLPRIVAWTLAMTACNGGSEEDRLLATEGGYLIGTRIWDDTSTTSYFQVVPSLDADVEVDLDQALELPGAAKVFSIPGAGWYAIGSGESPTITRYTVEDGTLEKRATISLADYGVDSLWDTLYVVSANKMYYPDRDGQRLIIIDPKQMEIEGEVDLAETGRDGFLALYGYAPMIRGDQLLFSVAWVDWDETDSMLGETGLGVIDTETDELVRFDVDDRCGGVTQPVTTASGDTYLVSSALASAAHHLGRLSTAPCALRVRAERAAFDPDFALALEGIAGSGLVGEPVPGGADRILLRAFDSEEGAALDEGATWELTSQPHWRWLRWDTDSGEVEPMPELDPATADVLWFQVDDRVLVSETADDYSETTLHELELSSGTAERRLTAPGFLHGIAPIH